MIFELDPANCSVTFLSLTCHWQAQTSWQQSFTRDMRCPDLAVVAYHLFARNRRKNARIGDCEIH